MRAVAVMLSWQPLLLFRSLNACMFANPLLGNRSLERADLVGAERSRGRAKAIPFSPRHVGHARFYFW
jgi:hypothetical protein